MDYYLFIYLLCLWILRLMCKQIMNILYVQIVYEILFPRRQLK